MAFITVREARQRLDNRIGLSTLYQMIKSGVLSGTKFGGRILVESSSVDDLIGRGRIAVLAAQIPDRKGRRRRRVA